MGLARCVLPLSGLRLDDDDDDAGVVWLVGQSRASAGDGSCCSCLLACSVSELRRRLIHVLRLP